MAHAITPSQIKIGPAEVWYGVTPPGAGAEMTHTTGEPASGTFIGLTEGPAIFTYTPEYSLEDAEQALTEVQAFAIKETAILELGLKEYEIGKLQEAIQMGTLVVDATGDPDTDMLQVGGNQDVVGSDAGERAVFLISPHIGDLGTGSVQLYTYLTLYRTLVTSPFVGTFDRRKGMIYKATFQCLADTSRAVGDQLFQLIRERIGP